MSTNTQHDFNRRINPGAGQSLPARILAFLLSIGLLIIGLMFSLMALAVVAVIGALLAGWLWWKTRALRQAARQQASAYATENATASAGHSKEMGGSGVIIEGEVVREKSEEPRRLH